VADEYEIPGYNDALAEERRIREEAFLDLPHSICGIKIHQLTPRLLTRLNLVRTPFIFGGSITDARVAQFLWILSLEYVPNSGMRDSFIESLLKSLAGDFETAIEEIDEYLDDTFLDAPHGGGRSDEAPYVCSIAWTIYSMAKEPFRWDEARTMDTPLRKSWQLMRCRALDNGATLVNRKSDSITNEWGGKLNAMLGGSEEEKAEAMRIINRGRN